MPVAAPPVALPPLARWRPAALLGQRQRQRELTLPLVVAAVAAAVRLASGAHPVDDAFITFRYARNLAEGAGLVYNPGEAVLGTTTPLWALLLAAAYAAGATSLPVAALGVSSACDAATAALLARLGSRLGLGAAGAALGAAWALNPLSVAYTAGGMETSLFVLLVLGSLSLAASGRTTPAALVGGLSVLVRPEGALAAAAVVGYTLARERRAGLRALLVAGVPLGTYALWLGLAYGSPVPQTVLAKQAAYRQDAPWMSAAILLLQAGLPGWSTFFPAVLPPAVALLALPLSLMATVTLALGVRRALFLSRARTARGAPGANGQARALAWQPFALFFALYVALHALAGLRGGRLFPWYLVPTIPFYLLAAGAALAAGVPRRRLWLGAAALVLWQLPAVAFDRPFLPAGFDLRREALYAQVGADLAREFRPTAVLAAPEIGALGFTSGLRVLDTVGLVSPQASRYYPLPPEQVDGDNAIPPRLIADARPDLVVTLDQFVRRSLLADPAFLGSYRLRSRQPAPIWLSQELLVFERVEPPIAADRRW